ncbi:MAG: metal ABC transporter permease [Elusimicrobiaceae bacterium]|nr:metal ABC transporter permease [Elusimicrobiaceae bacterium]
MISEFLSYGFVQRGLLAGSLVAVICALLGVFLVLKRLSLIGDGLSHVCLTGVALGLLTQTSPLYMSVPVVLVASLGILQIMEKIKIYGDAAIGIVSAAGLAVGILLTALAGGFNADLFGFLFGSILTVGRGEVLWCAVLLAALLLFLLFYYRDLIAASFDESFARTRGIAVRRLNATLIIFTSLAIVLACKVVGIFLISALIIVPPVTALLFAKTFKQVLWLSCVQAVVSVWVGVYLSFLFNIPSGATIILVNLVFLVAAFIYSRMGRSYAQGERKNAR